MPSKRAWFHRLPEILDVLGPMDASQLDRQGVERLFGVGPPPRPAMDGRIGRHPGRQRRRRLPPGAHRTDARNRRKPRLSVGSPPPATIDLRPGELRIAFSGAEDLAAKLWELSQAMAHDWNGFMRAVEE